MNKVRSTSQDFWPVGPVSKSLERKGKNDVF